MSFAYLLFCVNLLFCGVNILSEYQGRLYFDIKKDGLYDWNLPAKYSFEEGLEYTVRCQRYTNCDLHWEVEPYGLKSSTFNGSSQYNIIEMVFKLHRDDEVTIGCFSKNKHSFTEENMTTTFVWNKKIKPVSSTPAPTSIPDDADVKHKCYQKNNVEKCAFFILGNYDYWNNIFYLQINTIHNYDKNSLIQDDTNNTSGDDKEQNQNIIVIVGWTLGVAAGVMVLLAVCFICYVMTIRKRRKQQNDFSIEGLRSLDSGPPPAIELKKI